MGRPESGVPKVERGDHSSPIGPFSPSLDPSRIRSDGEWWCGGEPVPPSMGEGWLLLLLTPFDFSGAGFCNTSGVVGVWSQTQETVSAKLCVFNSANASQGAHNSNGPKHRE